MTLPPSYIRQCSAKIHSHLSDKNAIHSNMEVYKLEKDCIGNWGPKSLCPLSL